MAGSNSEGLIYRSSVADDVWHPHGGAGGAYEWWYFDAVSHDGRDTLVVIFLADFVFSPRFNREAARPRATVPSSPAPAASRAPRLPAVVCCLYRDGRTLVRAINEYDGGDFNAAVDGRARCEIGRSGFRLEQTVAGALYRISLDEPLRGGRRLIAEVEWAVVEGDFDAGKTREAHPAGGHIWNLVAPRCRVQGRMDFSGGGAGERGLRFEGTGYHDHNLDTRWLPRAVEEWQWGRAHFEGATAVFYRYREAGGEEADARLFVVRDGALRAHRTACESLEPRRDRFGLTFPRRLSFRAADEDIALRVTQRQTVDRSFFYLRFAGDAEFEVGGGRTQRARSVSEQLVPRALRWRGLDWLTDMRIGRAGRAAFLP